MPPLVAGRDHERGRRDRRADLTGVQAGARGLHSSSEHRVGGAAHPHPGAPGCGQHLTCLPGGDRERFFAVDVLARGDRCPRDLGVCRRDRQVEDEVDVVRCEEFGDGQRARARRRGGRGPGARLVQVADRDHLNVGQPPQRTEVGAADLASPYDTDPQRGHRAAHAMPARIIASTCGTSRSETEWPIVVTNTRPLPQRRVQVTGMTTPAKSG